MLKIYLARHGQDIDNVNGVLNGHRDGSLTDLGREQAQMTAHFMADSHIVFDTIYASPLQRAHETGKIIARELNVDSPVVLEGLIERDFGVMTGQLVSEIAAICGPNVVQTPIITYFLSPEKAETFPVLLERGKRVIADIQAKHTSGSVLLVTHGDIGKMIYAAYYDLDWKDVLVNFHFGNGEVLVMAEDSLPEEAIVFHQSQHNH
jgi:probable phosphoglycerate mutase